MSFMDSLRYYLVERNAYVFREFSDYVNKTPGDHKIDLRAWWLLFELTIKYRLLKRKPKKLPSMSKTKGTTKKGDPKKGQQRLPHIGAESRLFNKALPLRFASDLLMYDAVSFDIFDTLILRPFAHPTDLFFMLEAKLDIRGFHQIRIRAEAEARDHAMMTKGTREVTIYDIYDIIERKTGLSRDVGVQAEFDTELEFCYPNPYMQTVYRVLLTQKKQMVATSDMYLPGDMLRRLLSVCGYSQIQEIFVSCDHNTSKRTKGLYDLMINHVGREKGIIHVGDNRVSDIQSAKEVGLSVKRYRNVHEAGNRYRAPGMSEIIAGAYAGIVNTTLHTGMNAFSPAWEYGFIYGGLYVTGFCNWLHQKALQDGVEKILFLSRDGCIYQKVFNRMFHDVPNDYVLWSRIVNTRLNADVNREDFINRMVYQKAESVIPITIDSLLQSLELEKLQRFFPDYGLTGDMPISHENEKSLESLFYDHFDIITENWQDETEQMRGIISSAIGGAKRVAIVDVGWIGRGPLALKHMMQKKWHMDCEVYCYIAASRSFNHALPLTNIMQGDIEPYLFSRTHNRDLYDIHTGTNKKTNSVYFELFSQAQHPSFRGIDKNGLYAFDVPDVENYDTIKEIHDGIYAFCDRYLKTFDRYPHMLNIPGRDAYLPYRFIIRDLRFIKRHFSDFLYSRGVGGDLSSQSIETIGQLLSKFDL